MGEQPRLDQLETLDAVASTADARTTRDAVGIASGDRIGKYTIGRRVGRGGMGVVYLARDERLGREVAIKLGYASGVGSLGRAEREAQSLAKLSHPNVVVVYEVGEHAAHLFVVMEYVAGGTARTWLAETPRTWRQIVALYAAAGSGLAAAHAAGIVHRDFKPDNVLVGPDGRPRVADFGLALAPGTPSGPPGSPVLGSPRLTSTGAVVGTPAYMAPEQLAGSDADERADQFAFCVALWEALFGARPFTGKTIEELEAALRAPPRITAAKVPRHIADVLRRGLAPDPAQRWPSMAALVALLERDRRRPRLFAGAIAAGVILIAAAGAMVVRHKDPCDVVGDEVAGVWNPARAFVIRATFVAAGGGAAWPAAQTTLDAYATDLIGVARGACRASRRGDQAPELTDARESCMYRARARLDAIASGLTGASRRTVGGALEELRTLPDLAECADHGLVKLAFPSEPTVRFRSAVLESALTEAQASMYAHVPQPTDELDRFVAMAKAIGVPSIEAFSIDMRGRAAFATGDLNLARANYEAATHLFVEAGEDASAAQAMLDLADSHADSGHFDDTEHWTRLAESLVHRLSDPPEYTSRIAGLDAQLDEGRGQFREAAKLRRRQVELSRQAYHDLPNEIIDHQNLAFAAHDDGDPVEMERESRAGRALVERELGADHPQTVFFDTFDASAFVEQGRLADAEHAARHMIAVATKWYGADSSDAMGGWMNLAAVLERRGEIVEYMAANDRALAIANLRDPNSTTAGKLETNVATALAMQNKLAAAKPHGERAAAILERLIGADSFDLINLVITRAYIARGLGELDDSRRLLEHAVAISDKADHDRVNPRIELSYTLVLMKRAPDAVKELYSVAPIAASQATEPRIAAEYHLALAKALTDSGAHDRAVAEATTSRDAFAALGPDFVPQRDEAAAWLQAHR